MLTSLRRKYKLINVHIHQISSYRSIHKNYIPNAHILIILYINNIYVCIYIVGIYRCVVRKKRFNIVKYVNRYFYHILRFIHILYINIYYV